MSKLDELMGYWKQLEGNMERREQLVKVGRFVCDGVCDKGLTPEDIEHLKNDVESFKDKSNKVAEAFNELFNKTFIPYPIEEEVE